MAPRTHKPDASRRQQRLAISFIAATGGFVLAAGCDAPQPTPPKARALASALPSPRLASSTRSSTKLLATATRLDDLPTTASCLVQTGSGVRLVRAAANGALIEHKLHARGPHDAVGHVLHPGFSGETIVELQAASDSSGATQGRFAVITRSLKRGLSQVRLHRFQHGEVGAQAPLLLAGPSRLARKHNSRQGYIHLAATSKGYASFFVAGETPCEHDLDQACLQILSRHYPSGRKLRPSLSLPSPCARPLVGFLRHPRFHHYAVCNRQSRGPVTTLFSAQAEPAYAQVDQLLEGCQPSAFLSAALNPTRSHWLVGHCGKQRRAVHFRGTSVGRRTQHLAGEDLACDKHNRLTYRGIALAHTARSMATGGNLATALDLALLGHSLHSASATFANKTLFITSNHKLRPQVSRLRCKHKLIQID